MDWELYERYRATVVLVGVAVLSFLLLAFQNSSPVRHLRNGLAFCTLPLQQFVSPGVGQPPAEPRLVMSPTTSEGGSPGVVGEVSAEHARAFQVLAEENKRLHELLDLKERRWPTSVAAQVIDRNPQRWFGEILLDKGRDDGIPVDAPVVTVAGAQEGLVGRVVEVGPHVAKVMLIQDSLSAVAGYIEGAESDDGVVEGNDGADVLFQYVGRDSHLKIGDRVFTSGMGRVFPEGIPIGWVEDISLGERQLFLQARVRPMISVMHLRSVLVLVRNP